MRRALVTGLFLMSSGCLSSNDGIWLVQVSQGEFEQGEYFCDENMRDATCAEQGESPNSEWLYSQDLKGSPALAFAQIVEGPGGEMYLTLLEEVYVGSKKGSVMTFQWTHTEEQNNSSIHEDDYEYRVVSVQAEVTTITLDRSGRDFTGTMVEETVDAFTWSETDEWNELATGVTSGSLPARDYLVEDEQSGSENVPFERDCEGNPCRLEVENSYTFTHQLSGTRTRYPADAYGGVVSAGQGEGIEN